MDTFNACEMAIIRASQYILIIRNQQVDGSSPFPGFFFFLKSKIYVYHFRYDLLLDSICRQHENVLSPLFFALITR